MIMQPESVMNPGKSQSAGWLKTVSVPMNSLADGLKPGNLEKFDGLPAGATERLLRAKADFI